MFFGLWCCSSCKIDADLFCLALNTYMIKIHIVYMIFNLSQHKKTKEMILNGCEVKQQIEYYFDEVLNSLLHGLAKLAAVWGTEVGF